jgi:hypothetical protein
VSSRIERMQKGDRRALHELLSQHGAALEALRDALLDPAAPATVAELAVRIWRATVVARPDLDERAFAIAISASYLARGAPAAELSVPTADVAGYARRAAMHASGLGDALDAQILKEQGDRDPALAKVAKKISAAIATARAVAPGPPRELDSLFRAIEPELK